MFVVVGLGNPESKYKKTRHNVGFMVLDKLLKKLFPFGKSHWQNKKKIDCQIAKRENFLLAKPQMAMNANGFAIKRLVNFYKVSEEDLVIVHDDLDLPLGQVKITKNNTAAGHRGVQSVIDNLSTKNFWRVRVGIGHPLPPGRKYGFRHEDNSPREVVDFVLAPFGRQEGDKIRRVVKKTVRLIATGLEEGMERVKSKHSI